MKIHDVYGDLTIHTRKGSADDKAVIKEIFKENVYHLDNHMLTGGVVLDIGANIGAFTIEILRRAKHNGTPVTIYAIEPEPHNLELLIKNVKANEFIMEDSKVIILPYAIGGHTGTVHISDQHGSSRIGDKGTPVKMITIDDLVLEHNITKIDIMKIDTEDSEIPTILAASDKTIDMVKHTVIEFDEQNGLDNFAAVVNRFARKCSMYTLGVPSRGCYLYFERHI